MRREWGGLKCYTENGGSSNGWWRDGIKGDIAEGKGEQGMKYVSQNVPQGASGEMQGDVTALKN
jgi:hypothetical protein